MELTKFKKKTKLQKDIGYCEGYKRTYDKC